MVAAGRPIQADVSTAIRPAAQRAVSAASGQPATGSRPIQFGIAVKRKPAITAPT